MPTPRFEVLVLSTSPLVHVEALRALRQRGLAVRSAGTPARAIELLRRRPWLVLVDLVHAADMTRDVVQAVNDLRGPSMVVALHDGTLALLPPGAISDLSVDGYCHAGFWEPIAACTPNAGLGGQMTVH